MNNYSLLLFLSTDTEIPVIRHAFSNVTVNTDPGLPTAVVMWNNTIDVTDNSGSYTLTSNYQSGDKFRIGSTQVKFTALDPSENVASIVFVVKVEGTYSCC